jgi:hypothetical protein
MLDHRRQKVDPPTPASKKLKFSLGKLLTVEGGVSLGNLWVKSVNLFWFWISGLSTSSSSGVGSWLSFSKGDVV